MGRHKKPGPKKGKSYKTMYEIERRIRLNNEQYITNLRAELMAKRDDQFDKREFISTLLAAAAQDLNVTDRSHAYLKLALDTINGRIVNG
jgi:hypothetical protein